MADGFYSKKIAEDDLEFTFSDDPDGTSTKIFNEILKWNFRIKFIFSEIILSYTLATGSSATDFSLDDSVSIRFVKIHNNVGSTNMQGWFVRKVPGMPFQ